MGKNKEKITKREDQFLEQIKNLYIGYRKNYIKMYYNKGMSKVKYYRPTWALQDNQILAHIRQKETIGIFAGQIFSKFICFDVDSPELKLSKHTTKALVVLLNHDYNISLDDIHVSFSGKKGYHVEIFLDEFIESNKMEHFYYDVLNNLGKLSEKVEIELRPLHTVGLKLPLSIHKQTNKYCHFVDNQTLRKKQILKNTFYQLNQ